MSSSQCYYPNGDPSKEDDIPCSSGSDGVACCPNGWSCQDNGLCFLSNQNYYGRYTCTDKSWQSSGCPNICIHGLTAIGNEAVLECSQGSFCCDANRPELSGGQPCCETTSDRFSIQNMQQVNGSDSSAPSAAPSSAAASSAAATSGDDSDDSSTSVSTSLASATPSVVVITSIAASDSSQKGASGNNGPRTIVLTSTEVPTAPNAGFVTLTLTPSAAATKASASQSGGGIPTGTIVGAVVGGIAGLVLIALLAFFLLRRRRRNRQAAQLFSPNPVLEPMYKDQQTPYMNKSPELEGSTPDLAAAMAYKRRSHQKYESPSAIGRSPVTSSRSSNRVVSSMTQTSGGISSPRDDPVELPADNGRMGARPRPLSELPERSTSRKG